MTPTPDPRTPGLYLVIDGPPSRVGGRFMEVEDETGASVRVEGATWREEVEQWSLGPFAAPYPDPLRATLQPLRGYPVDDDPLHRRWQPDPDGAYVGFEDALDALAQSAPLDVARLLRVEAAARHMVIDHLEAPYLSHGTEDGCLPALRAALAETLA